ncbi:MAG: site-2 protease family protein [Thermoleophilia bacterium]|nr:site-2 protease family protein [Thermoleophilia bacterium]
MTSSIRLGRIAGIEIGLNWSWLVVFALIVWSLSETVFPRQNPGLGDGQYLTMAIVASVLFFAALLAHELGHAVVARREGMEIDGITLWLFGGVAKFKGQFPSAGAEFRIAIAGPLVTLVIAAVLVAAALALDLPPGADGVVMWLGFINVILLVFNLLPALPLDGGRVLRSAIWHFRGDFTGATRAAAGVARAFAFLFIALGVLRFFMGDTVGGVWMAFIGWFLLAAASAEARFVAVRDALHGLRVRDLMVREPATVSPSLSLGRFMDDVVWSRRYTTYPVVDDGHAVGLLPFRRVAEVPRAEWDTRRVADCMLSREHVPVLDEGEELADALAELSQSDVGRALVLEGDRLVGFLSRTDLARAVELGALRRRR